jgi:hypothetical protein
VSDNVIGFPASTSFTPEQALASAAQFEGLQDVIVAAIDKDGSLLIRSSRMTRGDALFLLEKAKKWALEE